jgi:glycogen debranching enzyme
MKKLLIVLMLVSLFTSCKNSKPVNEELKKSVLENTDFQFVKKKALEVVKTGFNAGDGYGEVWIRDYNTFIELSAEVYPKEALKENLRVFFRLQGADGNIIDGFIPKGKAVDVEGGYTYIYNDLEPTYCGHKNTVETDHESSLVQAVYKYVQKTGDKGFLNEKIGDKTVADRMEWAMDFLLNERWSKEQGMIWGATTSDWGDVQHCHPWGVYIIEDTKYCVDIYDNAMFLIAIDNLMELDPSKKEKWQSIRNDLAKNTMKYLWDEQNQKFIPHVYLDGSPFPDTFNENEIFYHGGTAVAIEAGLLNKDQIKISLEKMIANVKASGAGSIGLTMYPPYPEGYFENKGMVPYGYQNGGDWTWFGARMIQQLVKYGFVQEAYEQLQPMTNRVVVNDGFYEWYTEKNEPKGSGTFRGSAGVLYKAIEMLEDAVEK